MEFEFSTELWEYTGAGAWFFATLPLDISKEIRTITHGSKNGFGSVRVRVSSGGAEWETSIFPDTKSGSYMLPVKKQIRQQLGLLADSKAGYRIVLSEY